MVMSMVVIMSMVIVMIVAMTATVLSRLWFFLGFNKL